MCNNKFDDNSSENASTFSIRHTAVVTVNTCVVIVATVHGFVRRVRNSRNLDTIIGHC